jgi:hypothetical protein
MTARETGAAPCAEWPDPSPLERWWTSVMTPRDPSQRCDPGPLRSGVSCRLRDAVGTVRDGTR